MHLLIFQAVQETKPYSISMCYGITATSGNATSGDEQVIFNISKKLGNVT